MEERKKKKKIEKQTKDKLSIVREWYRVCILIEMLTGDWMSIKGYKTWLLVTKGLKKKFILHTIDHK